MVLKINTKEFMKELAIELVSFAERMAKSFMEDATNGLSQTAKSETDIEHAQMEGSSYIFARVVFMGNALLESYGTGSKMDLSNPVLEEYKSSIYYNTLRDWNGGAITGRPEGEYINFFGEEDYSTGNAVGINLEQLGIRAIKPKEPKGTIQQAEKWLETENSYVQRQLSIVIQNFMKNRFNDFLYNDFI